MKCFVLALLHTRQMLESCVIIVWGFFFLIDPILGLFFQTHFENKSPISKHKDFVFFPLAFPP